MTSETSSETEDAANATKAIVNLSSSSTSSLSSANSSCFSTSDNRNSSKKSDDDTIGNKKKLTRQTTRTTNQLSSIKTTVSHQLPVPGLNAHRFPQDPLRPPTYRFDKVPKCQKKLNGSTVYKVTDRNNFKESMAEMLLLCNEAMKRSGLSNKGFGSKPLSLEYIADRVDVDDPCYGYLIRDNVRSMLQGFITVTTFTNWQKSFRWDSIHHLAFFYDNHDNEKNKSKTKTQSKNKHIIKEESERKKDADGTLAHALQNTIRIGDPNVEGIVWPRIAEISLLGGLGCGKTLVQLAIEELENSKPTSATNYDFVVLQATDNSVPFYESLGFVRVGAMMENRRKSGDSIDSDSDSENLHPNNNKSGSGGGSSSSSSSSGVAAELLDGNTTMINDANSHNTSSSAPEPDTIAVPTNLISSTVKVYRVKKAGETPTDIAKRHKNIDAWDIVYINKDLYPDLTMKSKLRRGTLLHIPDHYVDEASFLQTNNITKNSIVDTSSQWFLAKENDTPRKIAKKFGVSCNELVKANRIRLHDLQPSSRLKAGTRVKISHFDVPDDGFVPYCHWTFPGDSFDSGEPSYMMAYRLNKKSETKKKSAQELPIRSGLLAPILPYKSPPCLYPPLPKEGSEKDDLIVPTLNEASSNDNKTVPEHTISGPSGFDIFCNQQLGLSSIMDFEKMKTSIDTDTKQRYHTLWNQLGNAKQQRYEDIAHESRRHNDQQKKSKQQQQKTVSTVKLAKTKLNSLFSKVVKLDEGAMANPKYKYWFVLTYIPDLQWCHLAPMTQDGTCFGPERKKSQGRPKWKLVDEDLQEEFDTSARFCTLVRSKAIKRTADADKEEWDILEDLDFLKQKKKRKSKHIMRDISVIQEEIIMDVNNNRNEDIDEEVPLVRPIKKQPLRARITTIQAPLQEQKEEKDKDTSPSSSDTCSISSSTSTASFSSTGPPATSYKRSSNQHATMESRKRPKL